MGNGKWEIASLTVNVWMFALEDGHGDRSGFLVIVACGRNATTNLPCLAMERAAEA